MSLKGTIKIESLEVEASVGVYPHEKQKKQKLFIDLAIFLDLGQAATSDSIEETINYDEIVTLCCQVANQRHYSLIESLAVELLNALETAYHPVAIRVSVKKPSAIIQAKYASVEFSKGVWQ